jgi:chromate transport protein ChrA
MQEHHQTRQTILGWVFEILDGLNCLVPGLALVPLGVLSLLTVLPIYLAIEFLRSGPPWAYGGAALWLLLVLRAAWHLGRQQLDRGDLLFLTIHFVASLVTVVVLLRSAWHAA